MNTVLTQGRVKSFPVGLDKLADIFQMVQKTIPAFSLNGLCIWNGLAAVLAFQSGLGQEYLIAFPAIIDPKDMFTGTEAFKPCAAGLAE